MTIIKRKTVITVLFILLFLLLLSNVNAVSLANYSGSFFEGFESGSFATNGWQADMPWQVAPDSPFAGSYAARIKNTAEVPKNITLSVSTADFKQISVNYYRKTLEMDSEEYLAAHWFDGNNWNLLEKLNNVSSYEIVSFSLPSSAENNPHFAVRFECLTDNGNEGCYIDNFGVNGVWDDYIAPQFSNIVEPASTYSPEGFNFSIRWTDNILLYEVIFEMDGENTTITGSGNVFTANAQLAGGTHSYAWHARDGAGNTNTTGQLTFTVNKAPTTTELYLNGVSGNLTLEWLSSLNVTAVSSGNVVLYRNGTVISNPETSILDVGAYAYNATTIGNENYSESSSPTYYLTIIDTTPPATVSNLAASSTDSTIIWQWNNPSDSDFSHVEIYFDGNFVENNSGASYRATGLSPLSSHNISLRTVDVRNNINNNTVTNVASTTDIPSQPQKVVSPQPSGYDDFEGSLGSSYYERKKQEQKTKEPQVEKEDIQEPVEKEIEVEKITEEKLEELSQEEQISMQSGNELTGATTFSLFSRKLERGPVAAILAALLLLAATGAYYKRKNSDPLKDWRPEHKE